MKKNILIITGEPSGDIHAGELLKELSKLLPDVSFWGIGGDSMRRQGVELIEHVKNLSIVGILEVIRHLPRIYGQYKNTVNNIRKRKPDLAILIDYPGFNLKIAKFLHGQKIPVIYYIIPQVWAWGRGRVKPLKRFVDKALVLFDFEKSFLSGYGIDSEFVGHPLLDKTSSRLLKSKEDKTFTIALLPGSRKNEIKNMFPTMLEAADKIHKQWGKFHFTLAESSNIGKETYDSYLASYPDLKIRRFTDDTLSVLAGSDLAIVTSGTATLETAIMEKPMVIVYKAAPLTYFIAWRFMDVPFLGLVNIIAGKEVVPELLQGRLTSENLSEEVIRIIDNPSRMEEIRNGLRQVKDSLGEKGASLRAAQAIKRFLDTHRSWGHPL